HRRVYITDRLGMPLIETVTAPEMRTPQEVAEVGQILRRIVRSTGQVRTGIGAARQDVNVSVTGGTRIEIKGVPRLPLIPLLTYNEAMRQWNLLALRAELHRRGITGDTFKGRFEQVGKLLRKTRYQPIQQAIAAGMTVNGVVLQGYHGLLRWQTQTDTYFSREISDRVRVIACLTALPNIIHSDSPSETLASSEWLTVRKALGVTEEDTLVLVWGPAVDADTGAKETIIRAREAAIGVPSETRQALEDGTNGFERILPGPDRMYPDTDLPPKKVTPDRLQRIRQSLPQPVWEREHWYRQLGIPEDTIVPLTYSPWAELFATAVRDLQVPAVLAAVVLIQYPKRLHKKGMDINKLHAEFLDELLTAVVKKRLPRAGVLQAMEAYLDRGEKIWLQWKKPASVTQIEKWFNLFSKKMLPQQHDRSPETVYRRAMGWIMAQAGGRADGEQTANIVWKLLGGSKSSSA
ncbi:hypothetical protein JXO59_15140, partial [candidate division KSB1 bacterium]|nr:hypothetical protein [candidate division KSB1 bacterium]